jgi:very-short-patch-repair endonuclease
MSKEESSFLCKTVDFPASMLVYAALSPFLTPAFFIYWVIVTLFCLYKKGEFDGLFQKKEKPVISDTVCLMKCESEPERILLKNLIESWSLKPESSTYLKGRYSVELQKRILKHRVDFVVNKKLIVEVDGREWHQNRFYEDRYRDQELIEKGYTVIRFPAKQIYENIGECIMRIGNSARRI